MGGGLSSRQFVKYRLILFLFIACLLQIIFTQIYSNQAQAHNSADSLVSQKGQILPITAQAQISGQKINLEVTSTPQQQAMGLMYRAELADDRGMLFSFSPARKVAFWMKNCLIPLDLIFMNSGIVEAIQNKAPPCLTAPCPTYGPDVEIDQVIELRGGRALELDLKVGDQIKITKN